MLQPSGSSQCMGPPSTPVVPTCPWQLVCTRHTGKQTRYYHHKHMCGRAARSAQWLPATELHAVGPLGAYRGQQHPPCAHKADVADCPPLPGEPQCTPLKSLRRQLRRLPLSAAPRSSDLTKAATLARQVVGCLIHSRDVVPAAHTRRVGVTTRRNVQRIRELQTQRRGGICNVNAARKWRHL